MPKASEERHGHDSLEKVLSVMVDQMRLQQEEMKLHMQLQQEQMQARLQAQQEQMQVQLQAQQEQMQMQWQAQQEQMKTLVTALTSNQRVAVQDASKDQYDQLSKDVQKFTLDEETGNTFAYWYGRYGPVIRDSQLPDQKKRDLILMKLDEEAYRKYADEVLPAQPSDLDFDTTVANLQKLFASKKTLIRRRHECLRITCPPLTPAYVPFREYANTIKRMDEDARLKKLDYTAMKTL